MVRHPGNTASFMPIKRFADFLHRRGELKDYMELLVRNFNPSTVDGLMCRSTVSVAHDGALYDCDFNQQLLLHNPKEVIDISGFLWIMVKDKNRQDLRQLGTIKIPLDSLQPYQPIRLEAKLPNPDG